MKPSLSLVIPAYNEQQRLPRTLAEVSRAVHEITDDAELIVVDDGSDDDTTRIARDATGPVPIRALRFDRNRGKGACVSYGVREAKHPIVGFTDADSPYDLSALVPMMEALQSGRADVAIGARDLPESQINRGYGPLRYLAGKSFSFLTWAAIGLPFRDSQCGLKVFRAEAAQQLFALRTIDGFGFDFETLATAVAQGYTVERFPVRLTHDDDSRIHLLSDSLRMAADVFQVRRNLKRGAYEKLSAVTAPKPCPLCDAEDFVPRAANHGFRMVECVDCGLWYLAPMPTEETIATVYGDEYYESDSPMKAGYANYEDMRDDFVETFRYRLGLLPDGASGGRVLDVGAGFGYLLDAARERFPERWALEMSESAAAHVGADHRTVVGTLENADLPDGYFDVVSMQDCLEHLPNPGRSLRRVRDLLRTGGTFLATTPDVDSWLRRVQGRNWVSLKFPEHVALYCEGTLRRVLEEAGFHVRHIEPAGQYVRPDFVASRVFSGHEGLARIAARSVRAVGGARRRLYVPSGSLTFVATRD